MWHIWQITAEDDWQKNCRIFKIIYRRVGDPLPHRRYTQIPVSYSLVYDMSAQELCNTVAWAAGKCMGGDMVESDNFCHAVYSYLACGGVVNDPLAKPEIDKGTPYDWVHVGHTEHVHFNLKEHKNLTIPDSAYAYEISEWVKKQFVGGPKAYISADEGKSYHSGGYIGGLSGGPSKPKGLDKLPALDYRVKHPVTGDVYDLRSAIISLNDRYRWTREKIADWLDSIADNTGENGPDIRFGTPNREES